MIKGMSSSNVLAFWTFTCDTCLTSEAIPEVFNDMNIENWVIYANYYKSWIKYNKSDKKRLKKYHKQTLSQGQYTLLKLLMCGVQSDELAAEKEGYRKYKFAMVERKKWDECYTHFDYQSAELCDLIDEYIKSDDADVVYAGVCHMISYQDLVDYILSKESE